MYCPNAHHGYLKWWVLSCYLIDSLQFSMLVTRYNFMIKTLSLKTGGKMLESTSYKFPSLAKNMSNVVYERSLTPQYQ